jgi:methionyl-tRNA formyltransferase
VRIALFGVTAISRRTLETLVDMKAEVVGVVTTPAEFRISYSPTPIVAVQHADLSAAAARHGIPVVTVSGRMTECADAIRTLAPDVNLVVGWYYTVPKVIRDLARLGSFGVHASLLPRYRGGAPVNWALINGERETGVTLFHLVDEVDAGDIVAQTRIPIALEDTCATVYAKAVDATQGLLRETLPLIARDEAPRRSQDEREASWFPQRRPEDGLIRWSQPTRRVYDWVRALTRPYPGAFTMLGRCEVRVWGATMVAGGGRAEPGTIVAVRPEVSLDVATADGTLRLAEVEGCPWDAVVPGRRFEEPVG